MAPTAVGTLAKTPLAHALVYLRNNRLSGRFELRSPDGRGALLAFHRGDLSGATVSPPVAYFGSVAYELGMIDRDELDASLLELAERSAPTVRHGDILVARGSMTPAQRDQTLGEQICRKVHHLFSFPELTTYAFHEVRAAAVDPPVLVDPIAPAWRGLREHPPARAVADVLARVGDSALHMVNEDAARCAQLPSAERALANRLASAPMTVAELSSTTSLPAANVHLLVYLLVIAKCIEPVSGARATPSMGPMPSAPASYPSTPPRIYTPSYMPSATPRSGSLPAVQRAASTLPPPATLRPPVPGPAALGGEEIAARARTVGTEDYFEVLGVERGASMEAVRAAYFRLASVWNPDRLPPELAPFHADVAQIFAHMARAQQTLCDPDARRRWMASRHAPEAPPRPRADVVREIDVSLGRRDFAAAERASRALADADRDDAEALALAAWATAEAGEASVDLLRASLSALDRAVNVDRTCERALFYRACLAKRLGKLDAAYRDFARVVHLNPKHVDAVREVRLHEIRARKGSGEHTLGGLLDRVRGQKK